MDLNLKGKHALVCGASRGIGMSTAIALSKLGADITLVARNAQKLESVRASLHNQQQSHHCLALDFSDPSSVRSAIDTLVETRPVHILINNTGGPKGGPLLSADVDAFSAAMQMHLHCSHHLVQAVVPGMRAAQYGRIINIISTSVKAPIPGLGVSNTTRGAMASWAKTLAGELGAYAITVNNVLPGFTDTERLTEIINSKAAKTGNSPEVVRDTMINGVPARRFAHPDETASAVAFLASPAASYINGINLPVDGGRTVCL